jgi:type I restriction enzyme, S subunit
MEKYDSYKFSGIDWIGEIPSHWEAVKLKYLTESRKELSEDGCEELLSVTESRGIVKRQELKGNDENLSRSENLTGYRLVKQGNLVNNIMLMWKRGLGVSPYNGIVSPAYSVFSFKNNCHPEYFHYLLRSEEYITEFRRNSTGVVMSRLRLYDDSFGSVFSYYPPLNEQQLISSYLDKKTEQIDSMIEKIKKKIELLKEQRTSLINQCVTKGLDPNVEMKDSGVEWIGEIPKHWDTKKVKYLIEDYLGIKIGPFGSSLKLDTLTEDGIKVYGQGNVIKNDFTLGHRHIPIERFESDFTQYEIYDGDVLITMMGTTGKSKVFKESYKRGILDSHLLRLRFKKNSFISELFTTILQESDYIFNQLKLTSKGSIMEGLNSSIVKQLTLMTPPISEQQQIIEHLDNQNRLFDKTVYLEEKRIEFLKEYRQSLISSTVTGKVRVTEDMI